MFVHETHSFVAMLYRNNQLAFTVESFASMMHRNYPLSHRRVNGSCLDGVFIPNEMHNSIEI
jgi:hypothetical protein